MPACCVKNCNSKKVSIFSVPKNMKNIWEKELNMELKHTAKVCAVHFDAQDIIDTWESGTDQCKYSVSTARNPKES